MGIFDNATSVTINNKEVASMKIGEATIYEKEVTPSTRTVTIISTTENPDSGSQGTVPFVGVTITLNGVSKYVNGDSNPTSTLEFTDVPDGEYTVTCKNVLNETFISQSNPITVDSSHTSFTMYWSRG